MCTLVSATDVLSSQEKLNLPASNDISTAVYVGDDKECLYSKTLKRALPSRVVKDITLDMYVQSLEQKINSMFAVHNMEKSGRRELRNSIIEVVIKGDGNICGYRILNGKKTEKVNSYIKSILEKSSPFSTFPESLQ